MNEYLEKHPTLIAVIIIAILLVTFLVLPVHMKLVSKVMFLMSIGLAMVLIFQKHWHAYKNDEYTREKMLRNLILDLFGLLCAMSTAIYAGRLAGGYVGSRAGLWLGLLTGFAGGFAAAWAVRRAWSRLVSLA